MLTTVRTYTGCNEEDLGYIFDAYKWHIFDPREVARFVNLIGQPYDPYAYDPAHFDPKSGKDRADAQAQQQNTAQRAGSTMPLAVPFLPFLVDTSIVTNFLIGASVVLRRVSVVAAIGDFFLDAPSTAPASVDELSPIIRKEQEDAAHQDEGVRGGGKDRSLEGTLDQAAGMKDYQQEMVRKGGSKKGGYVPSDKKSQQDADHALRQVRSLQDLEDQ